MNQVKGKSVAKQRSFFDRVVQKVRRDMGYAWTSKFIDVLRKAVRASRIGFDFGRSTLTGDRLMCNLQHEAMLREREEQFHMANGEDIPDPQLFPGLMIAWEEMPTTVSIDDDLIDYAREVEANFADVSLDTVRALFPACLLIDVRNRKLEMYKIPVDALFVYPSYDEDNRYELLLIVGVSLRYGLHEPLCGKFVMQRQLLGEAVEHTIEERERIRKRCLSGTDYGAHDVIFAPFEDEEKIMLLASETLGLMCWEGTSIERTQRRRRPHLRVMRRSADMEAAAKQPPSGEPSADHNLGVSPNTESPNIQEESPASPPASFGPEAEESATGAPASEAEALAAEVPASQPEKPIIEALASADSSFQEALLEEIARLEANLAEQRAKISSLSYHLQQAQRSLEETQAALRSQTKRAGMFEQMELPTTAAAVVDLACEAFADRLVFLDSAHKSAEKYVRGNVPEVWSVLRSMAVVLHPLVFGHDGANVVYAYEAQTGFELTLREMKQIKRVDSLARLRSTTYKGKQHSIAAHVKGRGRARGETLRVHFFADYDEEKLVIAHCGEHLATYDTSSL